MNHNHSYPVLPLDDLPREWEELNLPSGTTIIDPSPRIAEKRSAVWIFLWCVGPCVRPTRVRVRRHDRSWVKEKHDFLTRQKLEEMARVLVSAIRQEIDRERAMEAGQKAGKLPVTPMFKASFRCQVVGQELHVTSNWPNVDALLEGRDPYPMKWLTQQAGVPVVPMPGPHDTVLFRTTPKFKAQAWWHPGVRRHDFLERAVERAWSKIERIMMDCVLRQMASLPPV